MEKNYSNEAWYKTAKKKNLGIALIIFGVGLVLGLAIITTGRIKINNAKKEYAEYKEKLNKEIAAQKEKLEKEETKKEETKLTEEEKTAKKTELEAKINAVKEEIAKLEEEKAKLSDNLGEEIIIGQKIIEKQAQQYKLESELDEIEREDFVVEDSTSEMGKEIQNQLYNAFSNALSNADIKNKNNLSESMQDPTFDKLFKTLGTELNSTVEYTFTTARYIIFYVVGYTLIAGSTMASIAFYFLSMSSAINKHKEVDTKKEEKPAKKEKTEEVKEEK
jgi:hypothetical protein